MAQQRPSRRVNGTTTWLTLALALVLICTALAALDIYGTREAIHPVLLEQTGDPEAAAGLLVQHAYEYEDQLSWTSTSRFTADGLAETETDYHYKDQREARIRNPFAPVLKLAKTYEMTWAPLELASGGTGDNSGFTAAYNQYAAQVKPGEERSFTLLHADYQTHYGIAGELHLPGLDTSWEDGMFVHDELAWNVGEAFNDYLRIPVLPEETVQLMIQKSEDGQVVGFGLGTGESDRFDIISSAVLTDEAILFTFNTLTDRGQIIDTSELPDGYGIFRLPYTRADGETSLQLEELSLHLSLDPTDSVQHLSLTAEGDTLLVHTVTDGHYRIDSYGSSTGEALASYPITDLARDDVLQEIVTGSHVAVLLTQDGQAYVAAEASDGSYELAFSYQSELEQFYLYEPLFVSHYGDRALAYQDGRLAVSSYSYHNLEFRVQILDASGQRFLASYQHPVNPTPDEADMYEGSYSIAVQYATSPPLRVEWEAKPDASIMGSKP